MIDANTDIEILLGVAFYSEFCNCSNSYIGGTNKYEEERKNTKTI